MRAVPHGLGCHDAAADQSVGALAVLGEIEAARLVFFLDLERAEYELQHAEDRERRDRGERGDEADALELHDDLLRVALDAGAERRGEDAGSERAPSAAERVYAE